MLQTRLASNLSLDNMICMKLFLSVLMYLIIGVILGWGMLLAAKGGWWFLVAGLAAYVIVFVKIGCLPKSHH